jgi:acetoin utilization deacetylase AcuC-like enzyme
MSNFLMQSARFLDHDTGQHVENAGRLEAIFRRLNELEGWTRLEPRPATAEEISLVHDPEVTAKLEQITAEGGGWADADTCVSPHSLEVARLAVGGGLRLLEEVCASPGSQGFALLRPPGHHATPSRSMGFCLYSNIAIAARHAREALGLQRVFVLDWDVHHGNGTQDSLIGTDIPFVSFHQWPLYPGSGWYDERGKGNLYNLPLPAGCGDGEYLFALHRLVRPLLEKHDPELILVSAGYDAHASDPLGSMALSSRGFGQLASCLAQWCPAAFRVGFLEGGYHPQALAQAVEATLSAWRQPETVECPRPEKVQDGFLRRMYEAEKHWLG